jgi:hypothetical protein
MKRFSILFSAVVFTAGCSKQDAPNASAVSETQRGGAIAQPSTTLASIKVYKDPNCGCCKEWVKHLEQNGFKVEVVDMPDLSAVKAKYGVTDTLKACHTGVVNGYVVEGHVPADLILKMLKEKPAIAGLAVPGMPMGSPGMEGASKQHYDVLTFDRAGHTSVYAQR